jgi:uncharacterized protein YndB with AHSA1/START domain
MYVTMSVDIDAPPETVWRFLVEPELAKKWFTALKVYDWTSDPASGVGSTFYWEEEAGGRTYKLHFETVEWNPPFVFGYRMTSGDFFKSYDERWVIEATASGSRFTFNDRIKFPFGPLGVIIGWFAARTARKTGVTVLANLKRFAEEEARNAN